jgi:hypothetical protein
MIVKILNIMTVTKNELNQQNIFAQEPIMYIAREDMERFEEKTYAERAEKANSRFAMLGFVAAVVSYALTGHLFFGVI